MGRLGGWGPYAWMAALVVPVTAGDSWIASWARRTLFERTATTSKTRAEGRGR
jgi:hypothetical protein